jgi:hypothetical protein
VNEESQNAGGEHTKLPEQSRELTGKKEKLQETPQKTARGKNRKLPEKYQKTNRKKQTNYQTKTAY